MSTGRIIFQNKIAPLTAGKNGPWKASTYSSADKLNGSDYLTKSKDQDADFAKNKEDRDYAIFDQDNYGHNKKGSTDFSVHHYEYGDKDSKYTVDEQKTTDTKNINSHKTTSSDLEVVFDENPDDDWHKKGSYSENKTTTKFEFGIGGGKYTINKKSKSNKERSSAEFAFSRGYKEAATNRILKKGGKEDLISKYYDIRGKIAGAKGLDLGRSSTINKAKDQLYTTSQKAKEWSKKHKKEIKKSIKGDPDYGGPGSKLKHGNTTFASVGGSVEWNGKQFAGSIGDDNTGMSGEIDLLHAEASATAEVGPGYAKVGVSAEASLLHAEGEAHAGNEYASVAANGKVDVGHVYGEASATVGYYRGEDGKMHLDAGVKAECGAELCSASGSLTGTVCGVGASVSGKVKIGVGAQFDCGVQDGKFNFKIGASLGIGFEVGFSLDFSGVTDFANTVAHKFEPIGDFVDSAAQAIVESPLNPINWGW